MPVMPSSCGMVRLLTPDMIMDYQDIISFERLYDGLQRCKRGTTWKDGTTIYCANGLKNTYRLRQRLLKKTYKIGAYKRFMITDPKRREVMATWIVDRQFQRSLCDNYLYEALTRGLIRDNFACQVGRGVDDALDRMETHLRRYYRKHGADGWVLQCDIHHYFPETPHEVAKTAVRKRVQDDEVYEAVCQIIDSFGGDKGIGLGSQVSQLVQLAVLDDMDHVIKERLREKHYLRYMDDFLIISDSKDRLRKDLQKIRKITESLGLQLNKKTTIYPISQGIVWLKWRFILTPSGKVIRRMSGRSIAKMRRKLKRMKAQCDAGKMARETPAESMRSWIANARRGNTREAVIAMQKYYRELFDE